MVNTLSSKNKELFDMYCKQYNISKEDPLRLLIKEMLFHRQILESIMGEGIESTIQKSIQSGVEEAINGKIKVGYNIDMSSLDYERLARALNSTEQNSAQSVQVDELHKEGKHLSFFQKISSGIFSRKNET